MRELPQFPFAHLVVLFSVEEDPDYDPQKDKKKSKNKKLSTKDLEFLKKFLKQKTDQLKFLTENRMVWADAFLEDKENFFDYQMDSVTCGWERWTRCVNNKFLCHSEKKNLNAYRKSSQDTFLT